jgi:hypothetical protein
LSAECAIVENGGIVVGRRLSTPITKKVVDRWSFLAISLAKE